MRVRTAKSIAQRVARGRCSLIHQKHFPQRSYSRGQIRRALKRLDDATLQRHVEKPRRVRFLGRAYTIVPRYVPGKIGDGGRLLFLTPLNTRPDYYVMRFDSVQTIESEYELLNRAEDAAEDEFGIGNFWCEECEHSGCGCPCCAEERSWPTPDFIDGVSWSYWPRPQTCP